MTYVAFLRGINVGGNRVLPMAELKLICNGIGFKNVQTYIQSGNVIFESDLPEEALTKNLEQALYSREQKQINVIIRTVMELESIISSNPFPDAKLSRVGVMFFTDPVPADLLKGFKIQGSEEIIISRREIYIYYPLGMGRSKLKLPLIQPVTVRNINTITKIAELVDQQH